MASDIRGLISHTATSLELKPLLPGGRRGCFPSLPAWGLSSLCFQQSIRPCHSQKRPCGNSSQGETRSTTLLTWQTLHDRRQLGRTVQRGTSRQTRLCRAVQRALGWRNQSRLADMHAHTAAQVLHTSLKGIVSRQHVMPKIPSLHRYPVKLQGGSGQIALQDKTCLART